MKIFLAILKEFLEYYVFDCLAWNGKSLLQSAAKERVECLSEGAQLYDGDYVLVETKVPANFNAIDPIEFTVTGTHTKTADALDKTSHKDGEAYVLTGLTVSNKDLTASVAGSEIDKKDSTKHIAVSGEIYGEIINESGAQLPETGGMGTTLFYVFGAILVLGGGVVLISRRRMEA